MDLSILNKTFDKIFLITLTKLPRFNRIKERLNGLDYEVFEGLDGEIINKNDYKFRKT